jgi:hypothetical protein
MSTVSGRRVYSDVQNITTRPGRVMGIFISHGESTVQSVSIYDGLSATGDPIMKIYVAPERCPFYVRFDHMAEPVLFDSGLTVDPGNCDVNIWSS